MIGKQGIKFLFALIIIAAFPLLSYFLWFYKEKKPVEILIMNKTVTSESRSENKAAFTILKYNRIIRKDSKQYNHREDYYGFFPLSPGNDQEYFIREIDSNQADSLSGHYDMAWFIDTYGISAADWQSRSQDEDYSPVLYGGLTMNDYLFLEKMTGMNKLVFAEFNFFASPTTENVRSKTEALTDIYWSGWTGMYYDNLDYNTNESIPEWIVEAYHSQTGNSWQYTRPGIILANEKGSVLILENETHLDIEVPLITTTADKAKQYGVIENVHYPYRFNISYAADTADVISYFELSVNEAGNDLLKSSNIPFRFPAVTGNDNNFYYHGGNFSYYDMPALTTMLLGKRYFDFLFYNENPEDRSKFFWRYYYPFVTGVISTYYTNSMENSNKTLISLRETN